MATPVYDIETMNWIYPVAIGLYIGEEYTEFLKLSDEYDPLLVFLRYIRDNHPGTKFYAHNAVNFDNKFILQALTKYKQRVQFSAGLARLKWVEPDIDFEDSLLVLGKGLNGCCRAFKVEQKLQWDHNDTRNPWEMDSKLDSFRAYLKRDCISLSTVLDKYCQTLLKEFSVTPSMTLSLTATKSFDKNFYPMRKIDSNERYESFIRGATYGGRNEVFNRHGLGIYFYDIKSMYVSCYDTPVPIGKMKWTNPDIDKPTIAEAIVKVPQMSIGPLPYRYVIPGTSHYRLVFPIGEFQSWWDTRELRDAAAQGVDLKIIRQLQAEEAPVLKEFGEKINHLRDTAENKDLSSIWKLHGVRLIGKMGQNRQLMEIAHCLDIEDFRGWTPLDEEEIYHERVVESNGKSSPYIKPAVNMRIRAEARIRHNNLLLQAKSRGILYYCDNDSVVTNVPMFIGKQAGQLRLVDHATEAWFIRPKFYGYENDNGHMRQRTAGYHDYTLSRYDFEKLILGQEISANYFQSISNWKDSLTESGVKLVDKKRSVNIQRNFENRIVTGSETEPIKLSMKNGEVVGPYIKSPLAL